MSWVNQSYIVYQEDDEEAAVEEEGEDGDARVAMDARFLSIVKNMKLSHLETAALRLAIARNEGSIRSALESFRNSSDEGVLVGNLKQIALNMIKETMRDAGVDPEEDGEGSGGGRGVEGEEDSKQGEDVTLGDEEKEGTSVGESSTGASERLMSTQAARDHVFPILVRELGKEGIIQDWEGQQIMRQFQLGNTVISAALDIYDLDNDMAELVDTLQRVAKTSEGGGNRQ